MVCTLYLYIYIFYKYFDSGYPKTWRESPSWPLETGLQVRNIVLVSLCVISVVIVVGTACSLTLCRKKQHNYILYVYLNRNRVIIYPDHVFRHLFLLGWGDGVPARAGVWRPFRRRGVRDDRGGRHRGHYPTLQGWIMGLGAGKRLGKWPR
jgi:hypothetical protein